MFTLYVEPEGYTKSFNRQFHVYHDGIMICAAAELGFILDWLDKLEEGKHPLNDRDKPDGLEFLSTYTTREELVAVLPMHALLLDIPFDLSKKD